MTLDSKIVRFIEKHHVLTLGTVSKDGPYAASCFYAYDHEKNLFIFSSSSDTRHGSEMESDPRVSLNIYTQTRIVGKIEGLQITGTAFRASKEEKKVYLKRFPYTAAFDLELWAVAPDLMKLTDNTLGFGKKLIWKRAE